MSKHMSKAEGAKLGIVISRVSTCEHPIAETLRLEDRFTEYKCRDCGKVWAERPVIL